VSCILTPSQAGKVVSFSVPSKNAELREAASPPFNSVLRFGMDSSSWESSTGVVGGGLCDKGTLQT
jgi:hypothetical protein